MKYHKGTRRKPIEYEKDLVHHWKENNTFERSIAQRPASNSYVFYDGPPFITGVPHYGTLLSSIVKDAMPRYWTMKGKRVERVWGWDCHGLPAENFVEKKLGIHDRSEIGTKISLEDYITTARESMVQTSSMWEDTINRIGRWVDFKGAYKTMDKDYMESVWWAFKQLYEKGKIYEGEKVLLYDTKWATPLSKAEVTMDTGAYKIVTDPSVYVKFRLRHGRHGGQSVYLLAWTTAPWTLPGNTAVGVGENETYAEVEMESGEHLILLAGLVEKVLTDEKHLPVSYKVVRDDIKGSELIGEEYEPLLGVDRGENAHRVWNYPGLSTEDGSGVVHLAPAYGEEDFELARANKIPVVHVLDKYGKYNEGEWEGLEVWETNKTIAKTLHDRSIVWKIDYIRHDYPHNPRTGNRLMYRAHPSWFMDIDGQRELMLEQNSEGINWFPPHVKHGRFEKNIQAAPDWNLSRDRFWATAFPVWKGKDKNGKEYTRVVGSYTELKELSGVELEDYHRPWIDDVTFTIDGVEYRRVDKVIDGWFESGSMPFAQFHYPFENVEKFENNFPGDFIAEYIGQVRAWFYYMHAVNVGLFGHNAFKNVIVTGTLAGNDGRKMSKSYGNYTDPNVLMDAYSADALRFLLLQCPLLNGEDFNLRDKDVADVNRKLAMIWNMYDFFTLYAEVDKWEWGGDLSDPSESLKNPLDIWVVSRLHQVVGETDANMQRYDVPSALKPVLPFIEDASNWYIRRSRRRFWKSGDDTDKQNAYRTLHYVLVRLSMVLAPFVPFLSEELYRQLTGGESVHLLDWPASGRVDELALDRMQYVRDIINEGLSQRAAAGIKVRQPLGDLYIKGAPAFFDNIEEEYLTIIKGELNVKTVRANAHDAEHEVHLDTAITPELKREGMIREVVRNVQNARKEAGLEVDDRIKLSFSTTSDELRGALKEFTDAVTSEVLATSLTFDQTFKYESSHVVDGLPLTVSLEKHR